MSETSEQQLGRVIGAILERFEAGEEITVTASKGTIPRVSADGKWEVFDFDGTTRFEIVCREAPKDRLQARFLAAQAFFREREAS